MKGNVCYFVTYLYKQYKFQKIHLGSFSQFSTKFLIQALVVISTMIEEKKKKKLININLKYLKNSFVKKY